MFFLHQGIYYSIGSGTYFLNSFNRFYEKVFAVPSFHQLSQRNKRQKVCKGTHPDYCLKAGT